MDEWGGPAAAATSWRCCAMQECDSVLCSGISIGISKLTCEVLINAN